MAKKQVSFDAMVRFFMKHYKIPTQKDVEKLMTKLDRLETMVSKSDTKTRTRRARSGMSASDEVLEVVRKAGDKGIGFAEVQDKTGFDEKKIRNIIFRLNKLGRIQRIDRGIYMAN